MYHALQLTDFEAYDSYRWTYSHQGVNREGEALTEEKIKTKEVIG